MTGLKKIEQIILDLPVRQRALLVETLLATLPPANPESSVEEMEIAEAERRDREIEQGQVQPLTKAEFSHRLQSARRQ